MARPVGYKLTYEDYLRLPDDGKRHEIVDGEEFVSAAPATRHQIILGRLFGEFRDHLKKSQAGQVFFAPVDVLLSPYDVIEPDLLFVSEKRASIVTEKHVLGPPDLVVEVISETSRKIDEEIKRARYEIFGVFEYWVLDPENERATIYRLDRAQYRTSERLTRAAGQKLRTPLLPGPQIDLDKLFE